MVILAPMIKLRTLATLSTLLGCSLLLSAVCFAKPPRQKLTVGQAAPTPKANDQDGHPVDLAALYAKGPVLVYFYPKADTSGCTAQACSLRDAYEPLTDQGVTVIGVSTDSAKSQKAFQSKYKLPFTLIADTQKVVLQAFGVPNTFGYARREAFLIKDGKIVWHDANAKTDKQAEDVLAEMAKWKTE